jgi:hypothetical protein
MKKHNRSVHKNYKRSRTWSGLDEEPTGSWLNDFVRAGPLFVFLGLVALIVPVLKSRHRIPAVLALQPMHQTRADDSDSDSDTVRTIIVEGDMGVGSILVGVGLWVKR